MKYYSELTKDFYENEKDCLHAEKKFRKEAEEVEAERRRAIEVRRQRAAEVEQARDNFMKARKEYNELLNRFCNDYGAYSCSFKSPETINEYLDTLFKLV